MRHPPRRLCAVDEAGDGEPLIGVQPRRTVSGAIHKRLPTSAGRLPGGTLSAERVERRLAAILAADVAGYSRLMGWKNDRWE
jgi:class 3 adenylate cyclase